MRYAVLNSIYSVVKQVLINQLRTSNQKPLTQFVKFCPSSCNSCNWWQFFRQLRTIYFLNHSIFEPHHHKIIHHITFSNIKVGYFFNFKTQLKIKIDGFVILPVHG